MSKVTITKSALVEAADKGMTRKQMMEHFEVSQKQLTQVLAKAGLSDYKANVKIVDFVDDTTGEVEVV